jgi:hypothetical protein
MTQLTMQPIMTSDVVELTADLNELQLHAGDRGEVTSSWHYPNVAYEVEFRLDRKACPVRVLLLDHQVRKHA